MFGLLQQASGREEFVPIDKVVLNTLDAIEEAASSAGSELQVLQQDLHDLDLQIIWTTSIGADHCGCTSCHG